jgi:protein SCO1/2
MIMRTYLLRISILSALAAIIWLATSNPVSGQALNKDDPALKGIDVEEHLGDTIPFDVQLVNDRGDSVTLGQYFGDHKPAVLVMAYYTCPMLCNLVLNGVSDAIGSMPLEPGKDYRVLTVSIDPRDSVALAAAKKKNYVADLDRKGADTGWTYFVAAADQSKRLADAIGFKYYYVKDKNQYAHPAVITVVSPAGVVSRYLYGIQFNPRDLRLALVEASEGKIGTTVDRILLYCYHYDPDAGGYTLLAFNVMKLGGVLTLVLLGLFLGIFWIRESRRRSRKKAQPAERASR